MSISPSPQRGEIWLVNFDPTIGAEIRKTRPAIVVSADGVGRLPIKLVAPVTDWKPPFTPNIWHVRIDPDPNNGLPIVRSTWFRYICKGRRPNS